MGGEATSGAIVKREKILMQQSKPKGVAVMAGLGQHSALGFNITQSLKPITSVVC
jgi:hypothetical protein